MAQNFLSDIKLGDNIYIRLGDGSDGDLRLYHNETHSYIDSANTGDFYIRSLNDDVVIQGADDVFIYTQGGEDAIIARGDGAVELYHDNSKKFETDTNGVEVIGGLGVGRYPSPIYGIYQEFNSTDANTDNKFAYFIDGNFSGADNTDGDREQGGIKIDIDSTADGDNTDEHRLYGVWSDIRYSGLTDVARGVYTFVENNNSTGSEVTAETTAMYASSVSDGTSATAGTNNLRGVYGQAVVQNGGYAFNSYGVFGIASLSTNRSVNTDAITGTRGEVAIDSTNSLTLTNARAMQAIVDINSTTPTITNSFLLYGGYEGDTSSITNKYGLYLLGSDNINRLDGITMFQSGTAAAPSITRLAETDTGIYFPATDTIGFTTGGTERARIASDGTITLSAYGAGYLKTDANGVISVDTDTIEDTLDSVTDRGATTTNAISVGAITSSGASSGRYTGLEVVNTTNAAGTETAIGLGVVSAANSACDVKLVANRVAANSGSDFYIEQTNSSGTQTETFRITEDGDATFTGDVTISSDTPELLFTDTDNNVDAKLIANNGNLGIFADTNNEHSSSTIYFNIDGSEKARFTSGGKLGIGTGANLDEKLHVEGSVNNDDIAIKIENTFDDDGASSAPASALLFAAASNNGYIRLTGSPSDDAAQHNFEMGSTATGSFITFKPSGSTALTLDSSQNATFEGDVTVNGGDITVNTTGKATLTLNGDSDNSGDAAVLDSEIKMLHDGGDYGMLLQTQNHSGRSSFKIVEKITTTETMRFQIDETGDATFAGTINAPDGSATTPAYNFTSHDGNGMYLEDYDASNNKEQVSIATDGNRRMRVNEAGVFAEGNFYAGGDFRSFASPWHATAGTSGAGFRFENTHADTNNVVALDLSATGNATFAGDVTLGGTSSETRTLTLQTNSEKDSVINLKEGGATYGFSIGYYGVANDFIIKRHDNSTNGTDVFTLYRENNHASFAGNITTTGNLMPSADSTYNVGSSSVRWDNVYADNLYGIVDKLSVTANDTFTGTYSLLWHSGNVVYSSSFMTINGSTDTLSVPNISTGNATFTGNITLDDDTTESPYVGYIDNSGANSSDIEYRTYSTNGNFLITRTGNGGADIMLSGHATDHTSSTTTFAGDVTVGGDLIVSGDTVTLSTQTVEVEDNIIVLNKTQSDGSATASTSGIAINRGGSTAQASFIFDDGDDYWDLTHNLAVAGNGKFANSTVNIGPSNIGLDSDGDLTAGGNLRFATGSGGNVDIEAGGTFAIKDYDDSTNLRFSVDTSNGDTTVGGNLYADNVAITSGDTIASLSIYADTHNTNVANISQIQMSYQHSGGVGEGFIKLTEDANNSFGADMTFGVPHNNGSGGSTTRTALTLDGGTLAATFAGAVSINAVNDAYNFKAFGQDADSWFGVYDDANNSANIILTRSDTAEMFKVMGHTGNTTIAGDLDVGNLRIVGDNDSADQGKAFIRSNGDYLVLNAADGEHVYLNWDSANGGSGNVYVSNYIYAKRLYDSNDTTYYVDPSDTGTSVKAAGKVEHKGLTMTDGTSVDQVKEYSMTFQLTANTWTDTGINATDLTTGTYAVQVYVDDYVVGGQHYTEYYSGMMSWYSENTNTTHVDEIVLHRAGHGPNNGDIQLRTERTLSADTNDLMLQVKHNLSYTAALDGTTTGKKMIFKFRRLI